MEGHEGDLSHHGYAEGETDSPHAILKTAYKAGMIRDEDLCDREEPAVTVGCE